MSSSIRDQDKILSSLLEKICCRDETARSQLSMRAVEINDDIAAREEMLDPFSKTGLKNLCILTAENLREFINPTGTLERNSERQREAQRTAILEYLVGNPFPIEEFNAKEMEFLFPSSRIRRTKNVNDRSQLATGTQ